MYVDAAAEQSNQPQAMDQDSGPPPKKRDAGPLAPDTAPPPPDAALMPDAPAVPDVLPPDVLPPDLAPDKPPVTNQPQGAACNDKTECRSGHCVDGVCCENACDACKACSRARTGKADGICDRARDMDGKGCGMACSSVAAQPAVVEKVCSAGTCVVPSAPKVLTSCHSTDPCMVAFCDNNEGKCVMTAACTQQGSCCCRSSNGQRMCSQRSQCTGSKMCQ